MGRRLQVLGLVSLIGLSIVGLGGSTVRAGTVNLSEYSKICTTEEYDEATAWHYPGYWKLSTSGNTPVVFTDSQANSYLTGKYDMKVRKL